MAGRYSIGRVSNSRDFSRLQSKVDNLYDNYNYNSNVSNVLKTCDIIEENASVQRKLYDSLTDISAEGPIYSLSRPYYRSSLWPYYYDYYYYPYYYPYSSAAAAAAAISATDLVYQSSLSRKNAEIADLSYKYDRDVNDLENQLSHVRLDNCDLKSELTSTKDRLASERSKSALAESSARADIACLKSKLSAAEVKLASLEPQAELAVELEREIQDLRDEIRHVRATNAVLADHNEVQARIILSRPVTPCRFRSRSPSPVCLRPRSLSPCARPSRSRFCSPVCLPRATSPLSPVHCTQVVRQEHLISRFNDLYSRNRLDAMDILRSYCCDYENNQRIVFAAVQEAFSSAKRAFSDWKIRARSSVALTHSGPETLEEATQDYINRNVDLYIDLPCLSSQVVCALNRNPKISLPPGISYTVISSFIREACRIAWEMSALAYPLDTAFALDNELFDDLKYRRTYDSEYSAPLVNHHVWPALMQSCRVLVKGEACTRRGSCLRARSSSPSRCYRSRSSSPLRRC